MSVETGPGEGREFSYLEVAISERGLKELNRGECVIFIPKNQVQRIELKFGSRAERPLMQAGFGIILVLLGCWGVYMMVNGGLEAFRYESALLFLGGLGGWLLWETVQRRHYLHVAHGRGTHKLVFKGKTEKDRLTEFLDSASRIGYGIADSAKD